MYVFFLSYLGWVPIGISSIVFSIIMLLFPRILPRAVVRKKELENKKEQISTGEHKHRIITLYHSIQDVYFCIQNENVNNLFRVD